MVPTRCCHRPEQSTWRLQHSWHKQAHLYLERTGWSTCLCPAVHATLGQVTLFFCKCLITGIEHARLWMEWCSVRMLPGFDAFLM